MNSVTIIIIFVSFFIVKTKSHDRVQEIRLAVTRQMRGKRSDTSFDDDISFKSKVIFHSNRK